MGGDSYGGGHINDTYRLIQQDGALCHNYILQRINHYVFKRPDHVMENIERVTRYARERILAAGGDPRRRVLTLVPAHDGRSFTLDERGNTWRVYLYIDGASLYQAAPNLNVLYSAARSFGEFQVLLADLPGDRLHETIPDFHHTRKRFAAFQEALRADKAGRAASVKPEIDFILKREADASVVIDLLEQGRLPERVTHNDTKINNVLIEESSGEGLCVIDLDTVMPGSALYDFGDMVRAGAASAAEDEPVTDKAGIDIDRFTQLARGYADAVRDLLVPLEWELLAFSARLITFEQGIRFLGDYLNGDIYYKIHRPGQNLDRARTQLKMVAEMEKHMGLMESVIGRCRMGTQN
jgi:Ser/Thr protein kinase RdoA (MazF antagonist)